MDPNTLKNRFPRDLTNQLPEKLEVCPLHIQDQNFAGRFPCITKDIKLEYFMVTMTTTTTNCNFTHQTLSVYKQQIQEGTFLSCSLSNCTKKLPSTCFRNYLHLFVSAVWYSQLMSRKLKIPTRINAADPETSLISLKRSSWPLVDSLSDVCFVCFSLNPYSEAFNHVIVYCKLHTVWPLYYIERYAPASPNHLSLLKCL